MNNADRWGLQRKVQPVSAPYQPGRPVPDKHYWMQPAKAPATPRS